MIVKTFCNTCKKKMYESEKEIWDLHKKDYCDDCKSRNHKGVDEV